MADEFLGPIPLRAGSVDSPTTGSYVAQLQAELRRAAVLQPTEVATPGVFDALTEEAVRRLQWFASSVPGALAGGGAYVPRGLVALAMDGVVGPAVKSFVQCMQSHDWTANGLLVKVDFNDWRRIRASNGFAALAGAPNLGLCERSFASVLGGMNSAASDFGVWIFVNQLFRVEGNAVTGAVVQPASSSAHKIGRAI
ncbi:MAG TPA: peptidoglycan-binding domain-containing protein, partial [Phenylobacterium sp.]